MSQQPQTAPAIIEIASMQLKDGVTLEEFEPLDRAVEEQFVSKQPGFLSREAAAGDDRSWVVIVHWASVEASENSMKTFADAPANAAFMARVDASTMTMQRYRAVR